MAMEYLDRNGVQTLWTKTKNQIANKADKYIATQTYTNIYSTVSTDAKRNFFFIKFKPTSYESIWRIKYKVECEVPNQNEYKYMGMVELWGTKNTVLTYKIFNNHKNTSYRCLYYYNRISYKDASHAGDGIYEYLGLGLNNSANHTNGSYKRNFTITLLECDGCSCELMSSMQTYDQVVNTTNHTASLNQWDAFNNGLRESGDDNSLGLTRYPLTYFKAINNIFTNTIIVSADGYNYDSLVNNKESITVPDDTKRFTKIGFLPEYIKFYNGASIKGGNTNTTGYMWGLFDGVESQSFSRNAVTTGKANSMIYLKCKFNGGLYYLKDIVYELPKEYDSSYYINIGQFQYNSTAVFNLFANKPVFHSDRDNVYGVTPEFRSDYLALQNQIELDRKNLKRQCNTHKVNKWIFKKPITWMSDFGTYRNVYLKTWNTFHNTYNVNTKTSYCKQRMQFSICGIDGNSDTAIYTFRLKIETHGDKDIVVGFDADANYPDGILRVAKFFYNKMGLNIEDKGSHYFTLLVVNDLYDTFGNCIFIPYKISHYTIPKNDSLLVKFMIDREHSGIFENNQYGLYLSQNYRISNVAHLNVYELHFITYKGEQPEGDYTVIQNSLEHDWNAQLYKLGGRLQVVCPVGKARDSLYSSIHYHQFVTGNPYNYAYIQISKYKIYRSLNYCNKYITSDGRLFDRFRVYKYLTKKYKYYSYQTNHFTINYDRYGITEEELIKNGKKGVKIGHKDPDALGYKKYLSKYKYHKSMEGLAYLTDNHRTRSVLIPYYEDYDGNRYKKS